MKKFDINYLLKYVTNDTFKKINSKFSSFVLETLSDDRVNAEYNIRYLLKYGISNIDNVILKNIDDIILEHNELIKKIDNYEKRLAKEEILMMYENM